MPKLPTFTAKVDAGVISGGRMATAEDFGGADLSSVATSLKKTAQGYLADTEENESRQVLITQAQIRAKYAKRLDDATTSGEDLGKIREELDNELSTASDSLTTRKGAETAALHTANTGAIFDNQANQIQVHRATVEARVAGARWLNANGAILASNPGYLPQAEKDVDAFVETLTKVPPAERSAIATNLKQNLNVAAAMTSARLDPEGTRKAIEGGLYDMTPEQRQQVISKTEAEVRAKRVDAEVLQSQQDRKARELDEAAFDKHVKAIMSGGGSMKDVLDDAALKSRSREHLALLIEQRVKAVNGQERKSDPSTVRDLWLRVHAPDGDPRKIYSADAVFEAVAQGKVNTTDANQLNSLVANQRDVNNRSFGQRLGGRMQTVIGAMRADPKYSSQPELAASVQMELVARVERRSEEMRKEGKSPDSLLDPESKDYFFKPGTLKSVAEDVHERQRSLLPQPVDLRNDPNSVTNIDVGATFVDPRGVTRVMTKELQSALLKGAPTTPQNDFQVWTAATGGVLKPGQTQAQAIADWKAGK